jgi:flagellar FliL protein
MAKAEQKNDAELGTKKKMSKLVLILILALTASTAVAGFLAWQHFSAGASAGAGAEEAAESGGHGEEPAGEDAGHGESAEGAPAENAIINFEPFLVNLADTEAFRYLRVTIRLAVINRTKAENIAATEVMMSKTRDAILDILSSKTSSEIISTEGKESLKLEIKERLNSFLPGGPVQDVFFTDFVVQL